MSLAVINSIWIGNKLGPIHVACLKSFLNKGHEVYLHVYEEPVDVPEGIRLVSAENLLPKSRLIRYPPKNDDEIGSPAIFTNLLRYELLKKEMGLYVDCDVYCIKPIQDAEYIFGKESEHHVNNAILKLPSKSTTLGKLLAIKDQKFFNPPWFSKRRRFYYKVRSLVGLTVLIQNLPWGVTGPQALTWYLNETEEIQYAKPIDEFYPVHYTQISLLVDEELQINDLITPRTKLLHLYNEKLKYLVLNKNLEKTPLGSILKGNI